MNTDFDQMSIFDYTMPMIQITKPIRLIELFAGYGSQAMALERMGVKFEHYKVVEFDKYAVASYNAVHGTKFLTMDITKVHATDLNICDTDKFEYFMTYSFPCTDLSVAGKMKGMKKGSGTRSGLLWEVERIMTEINKSGGELPQVLFMENVPQVISDANIKDFHAWQDFLSSLGYTNHLQVLNAKDYGVAQKRERCFMFSFLGKYNYKFPAPIPLTKSMKDYLEDEVDEKYYIKSEAADRLIKNLDEKYKNPRADYEPGFGKTCYGTGFEFTRTGFSGLSYALAARDYKSPHLVCVGNVNPRGKGLNGNVENKECIDLSTVKTRIIEIANCITAKDRSISNQQSVGNGVLQIGNIMPTKTRENPNSQGICNALTSVQKDNMVLENLYRIRKLTPRECGRLMDVSDEDITKMEDVNSNSQLYKQFGNSIVVGVMVAMFKNLHIDQR